MRTGLLHVSWQKGRPLYLLLWASAVSLCIVASLAGNIDDRKGKHLFTNPGLLSSDANNETINELLLSAGELTIVEKNSFINLYLKPGAADKTISADTNREAVYKQILNRKIKNLKAKNGDSDFSVKPVPKK